VYRGREALKRAKPLRKQKRAHRVIRKGEQRGMFACHSSQTWKTIPMHIKLL
jgi:hypothetical protein